MIGILESWAELQSAFSSAWCGSASAGCYDSPVSPDTAA